MEIDLVPITQLPSRYGIARSNLYTRLKDLGIEPERQGKKAFVNAEQLQLLDALHEHIQKGGTTSEFLRNIDGDSLQERYAERIPPDRALAEFPTEQSPLFQPTTFVAVVEAIVKRLLPSTGSRLSYLRELEEAYEKGWLLSTSEVADLLKLSPKTIAAYGQEFEDAGFVFTRTGIRKGGEIAWAVDKHYSLDVQPNQLDIGIKEAFSADFDPDLE
jgi:DNA-binding transcriptional regulator YhcF (GntR family)